MGMFSAKGERDVAEPLGGLSIIAAGMTVRGDIESNSTVKVEGTVNGNVHARQQVLVAKDGVVQGNIEAREAIVGGSVDGAIRAAERVEVQAGATVTGDITTRRISVAEGGNLNGVIKMGDQPAPAKDAPAATPAPAPRPAEARTPPSTTPVPAPALTRPSVPVARIAVPPRLPSPGTGY
jgi:cytoskeletal protein CcmA (bactofilin family)